MANADWSGDDWRHGEALRIVETDTKIQRSLEAASAHANDIHRTLPWCAQKCPSRFGGLSMEGNDKVREEGGRSHPFHTHEYE